MAGKIPPALPVARENRLGFWSSLGLVALCALSVICSGLVFDLATDWMDEATMRVTMRAAAQDEHPGVAFVGTSRFLRGINTVALESGLVQAGCEAGVYVFAGPNLSATEEQRIVRRLNQSGDFDLLILDRSVSPANWRDNILRGDLSYVWSAVQTQMDLRGETPREDVAIAYNSFRIGVLSLLSRNRISPHFASLERQQHDYINGYLPFGESDVSPYESFGDAYQRRVAHGEGSPHTVQVAGVGRFSIPTQWSERLRRRADHLGWQGPLAFLFMPVGDLDEGAPPGASRLGHDLWLVNLNDVQTLDRLGADKNWFDAGHLSNEGTEQFAPMLAQQICALTEQSTTYALR